MRGLLSTLAAERGVAGHLIAATLGHEDERTTKDALPRPGRSTSASVAVAIWRKLPPAEVILLRDVPWG
jgi:hypothetical protein